MSNNGHASIWDGLIAPGTEAQQLDYFQGWAKTWQNTFQNKIQNTLLLRASKITSLHVFLNFHDHRQDAKRWQIVITDHPFVPKELWPEGKEHLRMSPAASGTMTLAVCPLFLWVGERGSADWTSFQQITLEPIRLVPGDWRPAEHLTSLWWCLRLPQQFLLAHWCPAGGSCYWDCGC